MAEVEGEFVAGCLHTLKAVGGLHPTFARTRAAEGSGGVLRLHGPWGEARFRVEARGRLTAESVGVAVAQLTRTAREEKLPPMLFAPFVNPALAERLRAEGVQFADAAGNAWVHHGALFVWVSGHRRAEQPERPMRAFQAAGLRLVTLLMHRPEAVGQTYRALATAAGISLGTIGPVLDDLGRAGFVRTRRGERTLLNRPALFERWELGYLETLRPRTLRRTCRMVEGRSIDDLADQVGAADLRGRVQIGGELAAARMTGHLRPGRAALHLSGVSVEELMVRLRLLPDLDGPVDLLDAVLAEAEAGGSMASAVLVHAELMRGAPDERLRETARDLYETHLRVRLEG